MKIQLTHKYGCRKSFTFKPSKEQINDIQKGYSIDINCPHCNMTSASTVIKDLVKELK